jgi:topoisomerase-4 subunit B
MPPASRWSCTPTTPSPSATTAAASPSTRIPKFPDKSALEVILCTLHAGGKFSGKAYQTSGGLHGVGVSVVNALSDHLRVEVARNRELFVQEFSRGLPQGPVRSEGTVANRRGTSVTFHADEQIFGSHRFKPARLIKMVRSKAYLFSGVEIRWKSAIDDGETPTEATFHFPGGLSDYLTETIGGSATYTDAPFAGKVEFQPSSASPVPSNGRSPGRPRATASSSPTATPCPRPRAARTRPGSGPRS